MGFKWSDVQIVCPDTEPARRKTRRLSFRRLSTARSSSPRTALIPSRSLPSRCPVPRCSPHLFARRLRARSGSLHNARVAKHDQAAQCQPC